jgi:hypothetical protein
MQTLSKEVIDNLIKLAKNETIFDGDDDGDVVIDDYAGGNVDDAYYLGERNGQTYLARDILAGLDIKWDD